MWPDFFDLITTKVPNRKSPFDAQYGVYVLIEASGYAASQDGDGSFAVHPRLS